MERAECIFKCELLLIKDESIVKFVLNVFDKLTPEHFWTAPASSTGKYHPRLSVGTGGLVRHTKYAIWWAQRLAKVYRFGQDELNVVVAALLLHDLFKFGRNKVIFNDGGACEVDGNDELIRAKDIEKEIRSKTIKTHGFDLANAIVDEMPIRDKREYLVTTAIRYHMGQWSFDEPNEYQMHEINSNLLTPVVGFVHLADYCSAQPVDQAIELFTKPKE